MPSHTDLHINDSWLTPSRSNHAELPLYSDNTLYFVDMEPSPCVRTVQMTGNAAELHTYALTNSQFCTGLFPTVAQNDDTFTPHRVIVGGKLNMGIATLKDGMVQGFEEITSVDKIDVALADKEEANWKPIRLNEATVDPLGRIWFASCKEGDTNVKPALYMLDAKLKTCERVEIDCELIMSNAMVFAPDGKTFYLGCSEQGKVWSWTCNLGTRAHPTHTREILAMPGKLFYQVKKPAVPDGMTVDTEGRLYLAIFNGGKIEVLSKEGQGLYAICLPTQCPTCTVFAGPDLDELVITSHAVSDAMRSQLLAAGANSEEVARKWPHRDGRIYKIKISGVKEYRSNELWNTLHWIPQYLLYPIYIVYLFCSMQIVGRHRSRKSLTRLGPVYEMVLEITKQLPDLEWNSPREMDTARLFPSCNASFLHLIHPNKVKKHLQMEQSHQEVTDRTSLNCWELLIVASVWAYVHFLDQQCSSLDIAIQKYSVSYLYRHIRNSFPQQHDTEQHLAAEVEAFFRAFPIITTPVIDTPIPSRMFQLQPGWTTLLKKLPNKLEKEHIVLFDSLHVLSDSAGSTLKQTYDEKLRPPFNIVHAALVLEDTPKQDAFQTPLASISHKFKANEVTLLKDSFAIFDESEASVVAFLHQVDMRPTTIQDLENTMAGRSTLLE